MGTPAIQFTGVSKRYGSQTALEPIDLEIRDGEFFCLLGPSGCGKSTTLSLIGGFAAPSSGEIRIRGELVNQTPPHRRKVNTVFQSYALFPHMNVSDNVAFGLKMAKVPRRESETRVAEALRLVALELVRGPLSGAALGRPAAACRGCSRAGQPSRGAAARRAARSARPPAAQAPPGRALPDPAGDRDDLRVRHPRSGRGDDHGRPHRRHERGAHRADRDAPRRSTDDRLRGSSPTSSASRTSPRSSSSTAAS